MNRIVLVTAMAAMAGWPKEVASGHLPLPISAGPISWDAFELAMSTNPQKLEGVPELVSQDQISQ